LLHRQARSPHLEPPGRINSKVVDPPGCCVDPLARHSLVPHMLDAPLLAGMGVLLFSEMVRWRIVPSSSTNRTSTPRAPRTERYLLRGSATGNRTDGYGSVCRALNTRGVPTETRAPIVRNLHPADLGSRQAHAGGYRCVRKPRARGIAVEPRPNGGQRAHKNRLIWPNRYSSFGTRTGSRTDIRWALRPSGRAGTESVGCFSEQASRNCPPRR
jgi:hypothetical protein